VGGNLGIESINVYENRVFAVNTVTVDIGLGLIFKGDLKVTVPSIRPNFFGRN
jgi:hypothetical protein